MRYRILAALSACLLLGGCAESIESSSEISGSALSDIDASDAIETIETSETAVDNSAFSGLIKSGELQFGSTLSCLNRNGLICSTQDCMVYSEENGNMLLSTDDSKKVLLEGIYPKCINIMNDTVYFIDGRDNSICSVDMNGENYNQLVADCVLFFAMSDKGMIYLNDYNELHISSDGSTRLITDKQGVWVDCYGEWLIYTEFQSGCAVMAYNTISGEYSRLLDYGFYPTVHGDWLYYQEREMGNIFRLNLSTGEQSVVLQKWGQQFCFINDTLYFTDSDCIYKYDADTGSGYAEIYRAEENTVIDNIFVCGDELYLCEQSDLFMLDMVTGEKSGIA